MRKDVSKINRTRLQRSFVGIHDLTRPETENWIETGHYYKGVEITVDEVYETDGAGREAATPEGYLPLGYEVTGSGEPAQNDAEALTFQKDLFRGTKNFAGLIGDKLLLFRLRKVAGKWQDNRISIKSSLVYVDKLKGKVQFSGSIDDYEVYTVVPESVAIQNGRLVFTQK